MSANPKRKLSLTIKKNQKISSFFSKLPEKTADKNIETINNTTKDVTAKTDTPTLDKKRKLSNSFNEETDEKENKNNIDSISAVKKFCSSTSNEVKITNTANCNTPSKLRVISPNRLMEISNASPDLKGSTMNGLIKSTKVISPKKLFPFVKEIVVINNDENSSDCDVIELTPDKMEQGAKHIELRNKKHTVASDKLEKSIISKKPATPQKNTPEKNTTPKKSQNLQKSTTPQKLKTTPKSRRTPVKLFSKSPKVEEFNVQVLENFVKITPSTSNSSNKNNLNRTPTKSGEKKQKSILDYTSPTCSKSSSEARSKNEYTPIRTTSKKDKTPTSSKFKLKLDFSNNEENPTADIKIEQNNKTPIKIQKSNNQSPVKCDLSSVEKDFLNTSFFDNCDFGETFLDDDNYTLDLHESKHCKILQVDRLLRKISIIVQCTKTKEKALCNLEQFWCHIKLSVGDIVHISAQKTSENEWTVSNEHGLIVYEPDLLISSTTIVDSVFCKRKSVLKERFHGYEPGNKYMVVGVLVHNLLERVLKNKINCDGIKDVLNDLLDSSETLKLLYSNSVNVDDIKDDLASFVPKVAEFVRIYLKSWDKNLQVNSRTKPSKDNWQGKIDQIQDIEENFWCPELGVKGRIDVTVKSENFEIPLELKTGKASMSLEHRGQVILYLMMMKKYGYNINSGLLLYLREGVLKEVSMHHRERRDLMLLRNELAYFLSRVPAIPADSNEVLKIPELPEPIDHRSACKNCGYNTICCTYLENEDYNLSNNAVLKEIKENMNSYLKRSHIDYFINWSTLLQLEASGDDRAKNLKEIYTMAPEDREKKGRCIIDLKIFKIHSESNNQYATTFKKYISEQERNLQTFGINEGAYVIISTKTRPSVVAGFVTEILSNSVTVTLDRDLNQRYKNKTFYIDVYDTSTLLTFNLTNLGLLLDDTERCAQLRKLIIDKHPPMFKQKLGKSVVIKCADILKKLNTAQQRAVVRALTAEDYLLIKGMPGTGKTATIASLIEILVLLKNTVLITSHTHSAIDNVCLRLKNRGVDVLRLGSQARVHSDLKSRCESVLTEKCSTIEELDAVYKNAQVLAVTCLGSGHPILTKRTLDYCIVDESTQVLQTSVIRVLSAAKKFILVGDPDQLPPVVRNPEAVKRGMSESLFERLCNEKNTETLTLNYRMNKQITEVANKLTYKGKLLVANKEIENGTFKINYNDKFKEHSWLSQVLNNSLERSVQIINTGAVDFSICRNLKSVVIKDNQEDEIGKCVNPFEANIIFIIVNNLLKCGLTHGEIGVISPYTAQVAYILTILQPLGVEVSTVDQFQGRDKEVILYSCSKSKTVEGLENNGFKTILDDKRRLTVAVTRAKHKFIMICDISTMKRYKPYEELFSGVENDNFIEVTSDEIMKYES